MSFNKNLYKKILAAATALTMVFAGTACGENTAWIAKCQNETINSGIYLFYQTEAMSEATSKLTKENADLDTSDLKLLKTMSIEGTSVSQWVNDKAAKQLRVFTGINRKFEELGLELTEDEKASAKSMADMYWQYYASMYEQNGIGEDSFRQLVEFDTKKEKVFLHYYGEGGEKECDDAQIAAYLEGNYSRVKYIKFDLTDSDGNALEDDKKAEVKKLAEDYKKKADAGSSFDDLIEEYDDYKAKLAEEAAAAEEAENAESSEDSDEPAVTTEPSVTGEAEAETTEESVTASENNEEETSEEAVTTAVTEETSEDAVTAAETEEEAVTTAGEENSDEEAVTTTADEEAAVTTAVSGEEKTEETEAVTEETEEDPYKNEYVYKKGSEDDGYSPSEKVNTAIFSDCVVGGAATIVEDEENNSIYLIQRLDIVGREDYFEGDQKTNILSEMFKDEFENMAVEWAESYGFTVNNAAVKRYDPFNLKL